MTEPYVPMLEPGAARAEAAGAGVPEALAELNVFRTLLRRGRLAKGVSDLLLSLLVRPDLDPRLRELVIMRIGWATGSGYEWAQHWRIATDIGVRSDDLLAVRDWQRSETLGVVERAALRATDESLTDGRISSDAMGTLRRHLAPEELVELVATIGAWTMVSMLLRSLDVPLEEGVEEWPPDGRSP